jgi:hypothetical protein
MPWTRSGASASRPGRPLPNTGYRNRLFRDTYGRRSPVAQVCEYLLSQLKDPSVRVTVTDDDAERWPSELRFKGVPVTITLEDAEDPSRPGIVQHLILGYHVPFPTGNRPDWAYAEDKWLEALKALDVYPGH